MANLKELRTRISSVKTTRQVTSAMKMVAAAKLRKAQNAIEKVHPYALKIHSMLANLLFASNAGDLENPFLNKRDSQKILLIVVTSNRGLCGAFNSNVEKKSIEIIENYINNGIDPENVFIYNFGKKGQEALKRKNFNIAETNFDIFDDLTYNNVTQVSKKLIDFYVNGTYDKIEIVYNSFKNAATQIITKEQFLPVAIPEDDDFNVEYVYEPDYEAILNKLIPEALTMQIFKALLDSFTAEHGARMTAMHKATDNASDLINELTLSYNKARQAAITNEIIEIVGGAEALNG